MRKVVVCLIAWFLFACGGSPSPNPAFEAEDIAAQLAKCQEVGRRADAGHNIEAYEACKADAGIQ